MKIASIFASFMLLLTPQVYAARRHHDALAARSKINRSKLQPTDLQRNEQILKPGSIWGIEEPAIATSYIPDNNTSMSGACGYEGMNRNQKQGTLIYGSAQMTRLFGNGVSCGTCLRLNATERKTYGDIGSFQVLISNSCPGVCHSLDLEVDGIEYWLKQPRVGQLGIIGEVVPCSFKENGVFIEVFQFTTTQYDVRYNFRGNSGAILLAEIACSGSDLFLPMKKENPQQYTLFDGSKSSQVLKCNSIDFRLTNFAEETIILRQVPNKLFQLSAALQWFNIGDNFVKT